MGFYRVCRIILWFVKREIWGGSFKVWYGIWVGESCGGCVFSGGGGVSG